MRDLVAGSRLSEGLQCLKVQGSRGPRRKIFFLNCLNSTVWVLLSLETFGTTDFPAQRQIPEDLNSPNTSTETSSLAVLRFNKERAIFYILAKQQVLKNGLETEVLWFGGIVSFCMLKCYERIKTNPKNTCVKTSKPLDRRLKISVLLLQVSSVASVIV